MRLKRLYFKKWMARLFYVSYSRVRFLIDSYALSLSLLCSPNWHCQTKPSINSSNPQGKQPKYVHKNTYMDIISKNKLSFNLFDYKKVISIIEHILYAIWEEYSSITVWNIINSKIHLDSRIIKILLSRRIDILDFMGFRFWWKKKKKQL